MLSNLLLLIFLSSFHPIISYDEPVEGPFYHSNPKVSLLNVRRHFVPLGYHHAFPCEAYKITKNSLVDAKKVFWKIYYQNNQQQTVVMNIEAGRTDQRFEYSPDKDWTLYGFGLQRMHDNVMLECWVPAIRDEDSDPFSDSSSNFVSRIHIAIQDCGENDELMFKNNRNPCKYGACSVSAEKGFERLECNCVDQNTGIFCDEAVEGKNSRLFVFYSPVILHFFIFFIFLIVNNCYHKLNKVRRLSMEGQIVSKEIAKIDLRTAYPSAFLTQTEIEMIKEKVNAEMDTLNKEKEGGNVQNGEGNKKQE